jgi:hypothetical protein
MAEVIDATTGEVMDDGKPAPTAMSLIVKETERPLLAVMETLDSLDWRNLKPHQMALLIMQKPMNAPGGGIMTLTFKQAILFATRCYELGVSPFSSEVWFNTNNSSTNLTLEGKRQVARNKGIDLGPPNFEEVYREWDSIPQMNETALAVKNAGFKRDVGVKCKVRVGDPKLQEYSEYTAYLSEWYVSKSPVWKAKPMHMLQTRAVEKAISMCMGTGASDPVDD